MSHTSQALLSSIHNTHEDPMNPSTKIKPMPFWMSVLVFGISSAIATISIYVGIPRLMKAGVSLFSSFHLLTGGPMAIMLLTSLVAYRLEGNLFSWADIKERFRLKPIKGKDWLWTLGLILFYNGGYLMLLPTAKWLASFPLFKPPDFLPSIVDPRVMEIGIPTDFLGVPLLGNWWVLGVYFLLLFFNIFGEEFWWRGYILPRQEQVHGKWTWIIHGLLWCLFHVFWPWNLIALLASTLSLSFVAYKLKNTTPGLLAHLIQNSTGLVMILFGIMGV